MPWVYFTLGLVFTYVVQSAVLPVLAPSWIDLLLALGLLVGLTAPLAEARLAACIVGFAQDLGSTGPLGLNAVALGLAAVALTWLREGVNLALWWVRWLIAFAAAWPAQVLVLLHLRFVQGGTVTLGQLFGRSFLAAAIAALLAALAAGLPALVARRRRVGLHW